MSRKRTCAISSSISFLISTSIREQPNLLELYNLLPPQVSRKDGDAACERRHNRETRARGDCAAGFPSPTPMTKIRFDSGITVTIRDGFVQAPRQHSPRSSTRSPPRCQVTAASHSFSMRTINIAEGLIRMTGVGKIVRRDKMPPLVLIELVGVVGRQKYSRNPSFSSRRGAPAFLRFRSSIKG